MSSREILLGAGEEASAAEEPPPKLAPVNDTQPAEEDLPSTGTEAD